MRSARHDPARSRVYGLLLLLLFSGVPLLVIACGEEGETPDCPALELYDITDPDAFSAAGVRNAREEAIRRGCLTPAGTATSGPAPGSGGTSGSGGSGSAGDASAAGAGGR